MTFTPYIGLTSPLPLLVALVLRRWAVAAVALVVRRRLRARAAAARAGRPAARTSTAWRAGDGRQRLRGARRPADDRRARAPPPRRRPRAGGADGPRSRAPGRAGLGACCRTATSTRGRRQRHRPVLALADRAAAALQLARPERRAARAGSGPRRRADRPAGDPPTAADHGWTGIWPHARRAAAAGPGRSCACSPATSTRRSTTTSSAACSAAAATPTPPTPPARATTRPGPRAALSRRRSRSTTCLPTPGAR